jgi:hypothetical protein
MSSNFPGENTIRQYLLGRLDEQDGLERKLSEQILFDDELSEMVDSIEEEIMEDYLDGTLSAADNKAVEEYFLLPPERKERLQFARLLRKNLEAECDPIVTRTSGAPADPSLLTPVGPGNLWPIAHFRSHGRTYCELAALAVLSVSALIYAGRIQHDLRSQIEMNRKGQAQLAAELAQERERYADLAKRLEHFEPAVAMLVFPGPILRGSGSPQVEVKPFTQRIRMEIGLQDTSMNDGYDVRLETKAGEQIWSQTNLYPASGGLRFEVPVAHIITGEYRVIVSSHLTHADMAPYWFRAKVIK